MERSIVSDGECQDGSVKEPRIETEVVMLWSKKLWP